MKIRKQCPTFLFILPSIPYILDHVEDCFSLVRVTVLFVWCSKALELCTIMQIMYMCNHMYGVFNKGRQLAKLTGYSTLTCRLFD